MKKILILEDNLTTLKNLTKIVRDLDERNAVFSFCELKDRGLGLYNVKELCEKYDANIVCRNKLDDSENWVEFTLEIAKADK